MRPTLLAAGVTLGLLALGSGSPRRLETLGPVGTVELAGSLEPRARAGLEGAVAFAGASDRTRSLIVWHRGRPVVEAYFHGQIAVAPQNVKSITKSLDALLVGLAVDRGLIESVDDPVARYLPERMAAAGDPRLAGLTVRHLLTMTSGLAGVDYGAFQSSPDWNAFVLAQPLARPPGERFEYDTPVTHLLSELVARVAGSDLTSFANRYLLAPIGAHIDTWRRGPRGIEMGGNDAYLKATDLARLGELVRRGGEWEGRRVISAEWLTAALTRQVVPPEPTINHGTVGVRGYGYLWWLIELDGEPGWAALGHGGQYLAIFPARELVVVVTSHWPGPSSTEHYRHLRELFTQHLLPAFRRSPGAA